MKSTPQTRIPSDIVETLLLCDFKGSHLRIILFISRFQFGFNALKRCCCSRTEMSTIGIDPAIVSKTVQELKTANVIVEIDDYFIINKNLESWRIQKRPHTNEAKFAGLITTHTHMQKELKNVKEEAETLPWSDDEDLIKTQETRPLLWDTQG